MDCVLCCGVVCVYVCVSGCSDACTRPGLSQLHSPPVLCPPPLPRTRVLNAPCDIWTRSEPCFFAPGPKRAILSLFPPSGTLYHFLSLCPQHVWGAKSRSVKWPQIRGFAITGAWPACADACRRSSALGRSCCSCSNCGRGSSTLRTAEDQRQTYGTRAPSWHA